MSNINKIQVGQDTYDVEDSNAIHDKDVFVFDNDIYDGALFSKPFGDGAWTKAWGSSTQTDNAFKDKLKNFLQELYDCGKYRAIVMLGYRTIAAFDYNNYFSPMINANLSKLREKKNSYSLMFPFVLYPDFSNSASSTNKIYIDGLIIYCELTWNGDTISNVNSFSVSGYQREMMIVGNTGYDATKTQVLKNVNGTLTWVDE